MHQIAKIHVSVTIYCKFNSLNFGCTLESMILYDIITRITTYFAQSNLHLSGIALKYICEHHEISIFDQLSY